MLSLYFCFYIILILLPHILQGPIHNESFQSPLSFDCFLLGVVRPFRMIALIFFVSAAAASGFVGDRKFNGSDLIRGG
jgi:hypothetical protein